MALAQRLNELAFANSEGLLHDDDYRLLRQNLFVQHSTTAEITAETPVVPLVSLGRNSSNSSPTPRQKPGLEPNIDPRSTRPPPVHPKPSVSSGVASFLRRATGRKPPVTPSDHNAHKATITSAPDTPKRGGIPRILQKKASELFSIRTDSRRIDKDPGSASSRPGASSSETSYTRHAPHSPTRSVKRTPIPKVDLSFANDIFDDGDLYSAIDIQAAIVATEAEAERVLDAFNDLEMSTSFRIHQQNARRLPSATPSHVNVLIEGREWRDHSFQPPSSPRAADRKRRPPAIDISDGVSVRSSSSIKTRLSQSKSISSLRSKQLPGSPLSPRFPPISPSIHRKNSDSSMSSQTPSSRRLRVNGSLSSSRSTGHLPLSMLVEKDARQLEHSIAAEDKDIPPEVADIRRRSREVAARYEARLEYLRAKLKGAQLHEKLMRK